MRISVVIPVYNEEKYLDQCLKSIFSQTIQPYEVIVVDNNSSDSSIDIAKKYKVKIVKESKQGITHARNKGFELAKGDIIARTDADCIVEPNWLEKIKEDFRLNPDMLGIAGVTAYYDLPFPKYNMLLSFIFIKIVSVFFGSTVFIGGNMIITKKAWEMVKKDVTLDDSQVHEDIDISSHLGKYGRVLFDPHLLIIMSARRIKSNPQSFFIEYPIRLL